MVPTTRWSLLCCFWQRVRLRARGRKCPKALFLHFNPTACSELGMRTFHMYRVHANFEVRMLPARNAAVIGL